MKISVALACYNGENFINEQLKSLTSQSRKPDELLVSDDCSNDGTIDILRNFAKNSPFNVKIKQNSINVGFAHNFNNVLSMCTGDLIFLCDQDDFWFKNKIAFMTKILLDNSNIQVAYHDTIITNSNLATSGITKISQLRKANLCPLESFVHGGCSVIRRRFLEEILPIPKDVKAHDHWISALSYHLGVKMVVDEPLMYYRIHENNTSSNPLNKINKINILCNAKYLFYNRKFSLLKEIEYGRIFYKNLLHKLKNFQNFSDFNKKIKQNSINSEFEIINILRNYEKRDYFIKKPMFKRILYCLEFYIRGKYDKYFNGWKSLLKDIFIY